MKLSLRRDRGLSPVMRGLLGAAAVFGVFVLVRELPALRRYIRIERM